MRTAGAIIGVGGAVVLFYALKKHDGVTVATSLTATAAPAAAPIAPAAPLSPYVQVPGQAPVYFIDQQGVAHHIPDWQTMQQMTGTTSQSAAAALIRSVTAQQLLQWPIGSEIPSVLTPAPTPFEPPAAVVPTPAPVVRAAPPAPPPPAITKLGNNDPSFQSWLASEINTLIGPATSSAPFRQKDIDFLKGAITNRHIPDYYKNSPGDCGAPPQLGTLGLVQEAGAVGGLGVGAAQLATTIAGTAVKALPIVGAAIGVFEAAYTLAFGHHAQAVKVEQNTLCNAVPLANQFMDQLDAAYRAGQISSAVIDQQLDALQAKFLALVTAIIKPNPFSPATAKSQHTCNAACVYARALVGIIDAKKRFDY